MGKQEHIPCEASLDGYHCHCWYDHHNGSGVCHNCGAPKVTVYTKAMQELKEKQG